MSPRVPRCEERLREEIALADASNAVFMDVPGLSPEEAWPVFAETELVMRAAGSPTLRVERIPVAPGVVRRIHTTVEAQPSTYEEEHFQWEEPRWAGVRRLFDQGPLIKVVLMFALHPTAEGSKVEVAFGAWARGSEGVSVAQAVAN